MATKPRLSQQLWHTIAFTEAQQARSEIPRSPMNRR